MRALLVVGACLVAAGCGDDECETAEIAARLEAAAPGSVVDLPACRIVGPLDVPAGITVRGRGADTVIVAPAGSRALHLEAGASPIAVERLRVESSGCAGILAEGAGAVTVSGVDVVAQRGIGIGASGLASLSLSNVTVTGALTETTADDTMPPLPPYSCETADPATHGVVLIDVADAELTAVDVSGFAGFGALLLRSSTRWTGGRVEDNVGAGVEVYGGSATLADLTMCRTRDGLSAIEAYNAAFAGGATVDSSRLLVCEGDGYGLMHDGAIGRHTSLLARDHGFAAVWVQNSTELELTGPGTMLQNNLLAGVGAVDATGVTIRDVAIDDTAEGVRIEGAHTVTAADGVHLVRASAAIESTTLTGNVRVGILADLGGASSDTVALTGVSVDGAGTAFGVVAQNGTVEAGWDASVTRAGATVANDAAFSMPIPILGAVGPPCIPRPENLETEGLAPF